MPLDTYICPTLKAYSALAPCERPREKDVPPRRTLPFDLEPGFHEPGRVWLYGNARLLDGRLAYVDQALGRPEHFPDELDEIEQLAEKAVLDGQILVCGIHNPVQQRAAIVPLRWGAPRIIILSGGFKYHLGPDLKDEPFRTARLWRYQFDKSTDLVISRRAPDKKPTYALYNPTVDRMITALALSQWTGLRWVDKGVTRVLA